ncbi:hypothetical protein ACIA8G_30005 [Lentzea sp. NPDC051213]|uniref:hypothetical protein n=1 Tax=Lentzea sp. NPDC051213 TaxID=3364126 RepID=UPI00379FD47B
MIKIAGSATCAVVVAVMLTPSSAGSAFAANNPVDLSVTTTNTSGHANDAVKISFTVTNEGSSATSGDVTLKVVTPLFVNADANALPDGCTLLIANPDPDIPNIADCRITEKLEPQARRTIEFPLLITSRVPVAFVVGRAIATPVPESPDRESSLSNNDSPYGINVSESPASGEDVTGENEINTYMWPDSPELSPNHGRMNTLRVGNRGSVTKGDMRLTYITPFYVNFGDGLPAGCTKILSNPDPTVPEVATCIIPPGLDSTEVAVQLPLVMAEGVPGGFRVSFQAIFMRAPDNNTDVDKDLRNNFINAPVILSASR